MSASAENTHGTLLDRVLALEPAAFALLHRPGTHSAPDTVDVLVGDMTQPATLTDIPLGTGACGPNPLVPRQELLLLVPYRQLAERGLAVPDDGAPLLGMVVTTQETATVPELLARIPQTPVRLVDQRFDTSDDEYAETVRRIVTEEIGTGKGANFVIRRSFLADISDYSPRHALSAFRALLAQEPGTYWTFVIHTGERTFVGATPERHVSLNRKTAVMNPISGTYRYPPDGPTLQGITEFLADRKETEELYMVLDEELKMMARICPRGGRVTGPRLREMGRLAHTEYFIKGETDRDVRDVLRESMFAPTVTGSPLESAARVISRYEPQGRGYYSGVAALIGTDADGERTLDSAILIRTADIDKGGRVRIGVGATLVRHSDPFSEVAETRAKVAGLLSALQSGGTPRFAQHPEVLSALRCRNADIGTFWLEEDGARPAAVAESARLRGLAGLKTLVIDAEDSFTSMLGLQLTALGLQVRIQRFDEATIEGHDLVVLGPGPGDPRVDDDPKIRCLRSLVDRLLAERRSFVAVCLSHQVLSMRLGLNLVRRDIPHQGVQREIGLFGVRERVGFYNTFTAHSTEGRHHVDGVGPVEVSLDPRTFEVHALRGPHFTSMQFHPESVLTVDGPRIVADTIRQVLSHED